MTHQDGHEARRRRQRWRARLVPYLLIAPAAIIIVAMAMSLWGLFVESLSGGEAGLSLLQYEKIADTPRYLAHFGRSAWFALIATVASILLGYPVAYYMEVARPAVRRLVLMFLVLVFFSDYVLRMFGLILVFGRQGVINRLLVESGLVDQPLHLMFNRFGVVVGLIAGSLPFMIFAISGVLARLDRTKLQAAALLGASPWSAFWRITLPLSVPGIVAGSVIVFLLSLNSYITPALLGGGFVEMVATFIYDQAIDLFNLPLGAAASICLFIAAIVVLVLTNRLLERYGRRFGMS